MRGGSLIHMDLNFTEAFTERTPRVVNSAKLLRAAARRKAKRFLVEGFNAVDAAVATGAAEDVFVTEDAAHRYADVVKAALNLGGYVHPITEKAAKSLSDTVTSPGIFATCRPVLWSTGQIMNGKPSLVSVPVETADPGNAGTLIRLSDALGADAVVFAGNTVDPQSPKVVRSSAGSIFHVPVVREQNVQSVLGQIRKAGLTVVATAADGEVPLDEAARPGGLLSGPTAWLFGNEAHGLPDELLDQADVRVRIPILGRAESLNLATAASICLYESARALARERQGE